MRTHGKTQAMVEAALQAVRDGKTVYIGMIDQVSRQQVRNRLMGAAHAEGLAQRAAKLVRYGLPKREGAVEEEVVLRIIPLPREAGSAGGPGGPAG